MAFRVAVCQMRSSQDMEINLRHITHWLEKAVRHGAECVLFPEMSYLTGKASDWIPTLPQFPSLMETFSQMASRYKIHFSPGTLREPSDSDKCRYYNTLPFFGPDGKLLGSYRKIFLFEASLADKTYRETKYCIPGDKPVVVSTPIGKFGLSICFDLRFPELFRELKNQGADYVFLPSAFTVPTGKAHWQTLVRARAIENQVFVFAPGLVDRTGEGLMTYGHSLIVNPWGEVLSDAGAHEGAFTADIDSTEIQEAAKKVNAWASRRPQVFQPHS